jgi:hypothetical protein
LQFESWDFSHISACPKTQFCSGTLVGNVKYMEDGYSSQAVPNRRTRSRLVLPKQPGGRPGLHMVGGVLNEPDRFFGSWFDHTFEGNW